MFKHFRRISEKLNIIIDSCIRVFRAGKVRVDEHLPVNVWTKVCFQLLSAGETNDKEPETGRERRSFYSTSTKHISVVLLYKHTQGGARVWFLLRLCGWLLLQVSARVCLPLQAAAGQRTSGFVLTSLSGIDETRSKPQWFCSFQSFSLRLFKGFTSLKSVQTHLKGLKGQRL